MDEKQEKLDRIRYIYQTIRELRGEAEQLSKEIKGIEDLEAFSIDGV